VGYLQRFNLKKIKQEFGVCQLVETGAWYGEGVNYAINSGLYVSTCEINSKFIMILRDRFLPRSEVHIYQLPSEKFLVIADDVPSVYFLDAHLPELYTHHEEEFKPSDDLRFPLQKELEIILKKEFINESVIIIDDLRIYHSEFNYEGGNIERLVRFDLLKWARDNFKNHNIVVSENDEGYLILLPKNKKISPNHFFNSMQYF